MSFPLHNMSIHIRPAQPQDVPAMLELVKELAVFEKEPHAVTVTEEEMHDAGFGPNPVWFGWVASGPMEDAASPVVTGGPQPPIMGMAICYDRYSTWKGRCLYLEDIVVTEKSRGKGIGEALMRTCIAHARQHGYALMRWQVLDWNTDAIRFYQRFGAQFDNGWVNVDLVG